MQGEPLAWEDPARLVDREPELAGIAAALETARNGEGSVVLIAGAAGTGKSALLAAAVERARDLGTAVRGGRGSELEQDLSFGVIRQLFEVPLRSAPPAERERLLSGAAAAAAGLFDDAPIDHSARGDGGFATRHGLFWVAAGIAAGQPLLLAVDDAHWVDEPTLRALSFLAGRIADVPIVLVVTHRTHEPNGAADVLANLESNPSARQIDLAALGPAGVAAIVRRVIPAADDELCRAIHESSAGNPLYVRELLRSVSGDGVPPTVSAIKQAAAAPVADRVMRRVAVLGPNAPRLAAAMSVLGASGRLRDAAAVAGQSEQDAAEAASAMRRVEILGTEDPFEWIHPIVRRSILDALTVTERDALHARAAEVLAKAGAPIGVVASHLSALRPAGSASVVAGLLAATDEALTRDGADVAVTLLRRALDEQADEPPRATLLLELGQVEVSRRNPDATAVLQEARDLSVDPRVRALAALALTESYTFEGRWDAAADISEQALLTLDGLDPELVVELELARCLVCAVDPLLVPRFRRDRARLKALALGESWPARALSGALAMVSAFDGEDLDDVRSLCEHGLGDGVLVSERSAGAYAPMHVLAGLVTIDEYERALAFTDELERAARAQGSVANVMVANGVRGWISLLRGDLAGGEEILRPLVDTAAENGMMLFVVTLLWWLTDVIIERPSREALAAMVESIELPPAFAEVAGGAWLLSVRGRVRASQGAREAAEADLRQAARVFAGLGFGPMHAPSRSALALVLRPNDRDEARALVAEELALADRAGFARPRGVALRSCGLLADREEGVELLRESVAVLAESPAQYEHACSLVELGAALRRAGRRTESGEPLQAGMELAHRCGAERLAARAREELLATGARPRKVVGYGFAQLTASERRIVRLAAEGRSNPEIAQALYVSVKTVETHLSSAYRKLGLSGAGSRRRLAELVAQAVASPD